MNSNQTASNISAEEHFAGNTQSYGIKKFSHSLSKHCRAGTLTRNECESLLLDLLLLFTDSVDIYFFKFASRFLTPESYDEIVNERNIEHTCGYPLCFNHPRATNGQYKIDYNKKGLLLGDPDLTKYCCKQHAKASRFYRHQLSHEPVFLRNDIAYMPYNKLPYESHTAVFEEIEAISRLSKISLAQAAVLFAQEAVLATHHLEDTESREQQATKEQEFESLVGKLQEISIKERDPNDSNMTDMNGVENEDLVGDHTAIEGYQTKN